MKSKKKTFLYAEFFGEGGMRSLTSLLTVMILFPGCHIVYSEIEDTCGNSAIDGKEQCDGQNLAGKSCITLGLGFTGGDLICRPTCVFDTSYCAGGSQECGNDIAEGSEQCDGPDWNDQTCVSLGRGFIGGTLACDSLCTFNTAGCTAGTTCGNGQIEIGEACDGSNMGGKTCLTEGYNNGVLSCNSCSLVYDDCCYNTCSSVGATQCSTSSIRQTCGNYDPDLCNEWGNDYPCPSGTTCSGGTCISSCTATDYWSPANDFETDSTSVYWNTTTGQVATNNSALRLEVVQEGKELKLRVCKLGGQFSSSSIAISVNDISSSRAGYSNTNFQTNYIAVGSDYCTDWGQMNGDTAYLAGESFGGQWRIVAPNTSVSSWPGSYDCSPNSSTTGNCWNGISITMQRTCLQ